MRVDQERDITLDTRTDIVEDIIDALKVINIAAGYKTNPQTVIAWRIDPFTEKELPAIDVFDYESEEDDNTSRIKHTLELSIEFIASTKKGDSTATYLRKGGSDILKAIGAIEERFLNKYKTNQLKFTGSSMGLDSKAKIDGGFSVKIQTNYTPRRWQL